VVASYIARLVNASHPGESAASAGVRYGASPRAALALAAAAKARGLRYGRPHASFEDVQAVAAPVLAHRILLDHSARLDGATSAGVVQKILAEIPVQATPLPTSLRAAKVT
jgi:MoxR-like ATPase